jgi:hypothetical protein
MLHRTQDAHRAQGNIYKILVGKHKENKTAWDRHVFRIILKWILRKYEGYACIKLIWIRIRKRGGLL